MAEPSATFILAFGDSLTAGYGLSPDEAFPARLQAILRADMPDVLVQNAGVSGDTTASALARLPRLLSSLGSKPSLAIVELGANDLIRRVSPASTRENLSAILRAFAECGIPILLASFEPPAFLRDLVGAYVGLYDDLAAAHETALHPFFPPGTAGHPAHVLRDRLHPNAMAIDKVARAMAPAVFQALAHAKRCRAGSPTAE